MIQHFIGVALDELLVELRKLSRADKVRAMQALMQDMVDRHDDPADQGESYWVWSPHDAEKAAQTVLRVLYPKNQQHD